MVEMPAAALVVDHFNVDAAHCSISDTWHRVLHVHRVRAELFSKSAAAAYDKLKRAKFIVV